MTPSERTIICLYAEVNFRKIGTAVAVLLLFKDSRCTLEKSLKTVRVGVNFDGSLQKMGQMSHSIAARDLKFSGMMHRLLDHSSSEAHCFSVRIGLFLADSGNFIKNKSCGKML